MRISDWSSDVCTSDLRRSDRRELLPALADLEQLHAAARIEVGEHQRGEEAALAAAAACDEDAFGEPVEVRKDFLGFGDDPVLGLDRKSVGLGESVSVGVDLGGRRIYQHTK